MTKQALQAVSALIDALPEGVAAVRFYREYQAAVRAGEITAVPIADSFALGSRKCKDDLVRTDELFDRWYEKTVRLLTLHRARQGVVAHADDVTSGAVDFDQMAAQYREQLQARVVARAAVKRPKVRQKRGKPKLGEAAGSGEMAARPQPLPGSGQSAGDPEAALTGEGQHWPEL